jgi:hypothetical protein
MPGALGTLDSRSGDVAAALYKDIAVLLKIQKRPEFGLALQALSREIAVLDLVGLRK